MQSFPFKRGDDLLIPCLEAIEGVGVNLTGYTVRAQVRTAKDELVADMTVTLGDQGVSPGTFTLAVPKATTATWEPGRTLAFDVEYTPPTGAAWSSPTVGIEVVKDITR